MNRSDEIRVEEILREQHPGPGCTGGIIVAMLVGLCFWGVQAAVNDYKHTKERLRAIEGKLENLEHKETR